MSARWPWLVLLLGALAFVKAMVTVALVPPFQTPDEYSHYDYAVYLSHVPLDRFIRGDIARWTDLSAPAVTQEVYFVAEAAGVLDHLAFRREVRGRVPFATMLTHGRTFVDLDTGTALAARQSVSPAFVYPPLYHLGVSFVLRGLRAAGVTNPVIRYYVARLSSVGLLAVTLLAALRLLEMLPIAAWLRAGTFGLVAFHPQLTLLSASVQPDNLAIALTTIACLFVARYHRSGQMRAWVACCAVCGALLLSKPHLAVALFGAAVIVELARPVPNGRPSRRAVVGVGTIALLGAGGWWMVRSYLVFGHPIGPTAQYASDVPATFLSNVSTWVTISLPTAFMSYWGWWGWLEYGLPPPVYAALRVLTLLPLFFYAAAWRERDASLPRREHTPPDGPLVAFAAASFLILAVEMLWVAGRLGPGVNNQGRNWLPLVLFEMLYLAGVAPLFEPEARSRVAAAARLWRARLVAVAGAGALLAAGAYALTARPLSPDGFVVVELAGVSAGQATLAYDGAGGFMSWRKVRLPQVGGDRRARVPVEARHLAGLRLEIEPGAPFVRVGAVRIEDRAGRILSVVDSDRMSVLSGGSSEAHGGSLVVRTAETEPAVIDIGLPSPVELPRSRGRRVLAFARLLAPSVEGWALAGVLAVIVFAASVQAASAERAPTRLGQAYVAGLVGGMGLLDAYLLVETFLRYPVSVG